MGLKILPLKTEEIDELDPVLDIFEITNPKPWVPQRHRQYNHHTKVDLSMIDHVSYEDLIYNEPDPQTLQSDLCFAPAAQIRSFNAGIRPWHKVLFPSMDPNALRKYLGFRPVDIVKKTLEHTTQLATSTIRYPMRQHKQSRNPFSNVHRLSEPVSTDPIFSNCTSFDPYFTGAQIYYGINSTCIDVYGMKSKGSFHKTYRDFIREEGAPSILRRDSAPEEQSDN